MKSKQQLRQRRKLHIRKNLVGTASRPRVCVFRSNRYISVQAVDDERGGPIVGLSEFGIKSKSETKPVERAQMLGEKFGEVLKKQKIKTIIFDRSGYKYHGRVKALAEGLRSSGIKF